MDRRITDQLHSPRALILNTNYHFGQRGPGFTWHSTLVLGLILSSTQAFLVNYEDGLLLFMTCVSGLTYAAGKPTLKRPAILVLLVVVFWIALTSAIYRIWDTYTAAGFVVRLVYPFFVVAVLRDEFADALYYWTVRLTLLALGAYAVSLVFPEPFVALADAREPLRSLTSFSGGSEVLSVGTVVGGWERINIGFFTYALDRPFRNHGFMWEPGAFAVLLNLVLALELVRGRFAVTPSKLILIAGVLSTVSTAGYITLFINSAYWLVRRNHLGVFYAALAFACATAAAPSFEFLLPKINAEFALGADYVNPRQNWSLTRYASFIFDMEDFQEHPLLGRGIYQENRYTGHLVLPSNNGLSDAAVRYGIFGLAGIFLLLFRSGYELAHKDRRAAFFLCVIVVISSWSERFFELPVFLSVLMLPLCPVSRIRLKRTLKPGEFGRTGIIQPEDYPERVGELSEDK